MLKEEGCSKELNLSDLDRFEVAAESDKQKCKEYQEMLDNLYFNLQQELNRNNIFDLKGFKNKYL